MESADVIDVARDAIMVTLQVSSPVMLVGLVVGLVIALFQALTQIQEMTLTFVPKILAIFASMLLFMPFMGRLMDDLMVRIAERISNL
ncbi:MAG TPA: flagellar biosynthesis protein FliQ [Alphaproteobacteria bacterium]|nr:flagellar biosynthesis protein FliQ [Alphaproteobacteria bacterium]HEX4890207.1 flagellar biosynthesis protein FliQ [Alphaproteobacteria bacterium]